MGVLDASTSPPKERYAVPNDNVIKLIQPGQFDDQLTEILRNGARALLAKAVEAEVADFLGKHADLKTEDGRQRARESAHDWRDLLLDLKRRGLDVPPRLVIAHGALRCWNAAGAVWQTTRETPC